MTKSLAYITALIDIHTLPKPEVNGYLLEELQKDGLIKPDHHGGMETTDRGAAYAELLRRVPLPVSKWVDPRTETGQ